MKVKLGNGLVILDVSGALFALIIIFLPSGVLHLILGVPFLLFVPGYALMTALFIKKGEIGGISRVALSFTSSVALVALFGYLLGYTAWGIRLEPVVYTIYAFVLITSLVAWLRWRRLPEQERFEINIALGRPRLGQTMTDRILAVILIITILGAIIGLSYTFTRPKPQESFTEFYVLGNGGKATEYPTDLQLGVESSVISVIINHEGKETEYRVRVLLNGEMIKEISPITLDDEQKWESEVTFVPGDVGDNQKLEFLLYKDNSPDPYLEPVYLWVDVRG